MESIPSRKHPGTDKHNPYYPPHWGGYFFTGIRFPDGDTEYGYTAGTVLYAGYSIPKKVPDVANHDHITAGER
jgi:hypothetical protein